MSLGKVSTVSKIVQAEKHLSVWGRVYVHSSMCFVSVQIDTDCQLIITKAGSILRARK